MYSVTMPKLSDSMEVGKILRWLVKEGDEVNAGDVLAEIESDKAAMELEFTIGSDDGDAGHYGFELSEVKSGDGSAGLVVNWEPQVAGLLDDLKVGLTLGKIAVKFHNTLAEMIVSVCERFSLPRVVLTGGCFQNCYLLTRSVARLQDSGFTPYWHQRIPPGDGGIALGQVMAAVRQKKSSAESD